MKITIQMHITAIAFMCIFGFVACNDQSKVQAGPPAAQGGQSAKASSAYLTDAAAIERGKKLFASKTCSACHHMDRKVVGPPLRGVTSRREAAWLKQMIQEPDRMLKEDPEAKKLLEEYKTPMPKLALSDEEADALMSYLHANK
jgi:cytochrome c551/c552